MSAEASAASNAINVSALMKPKALLRYVEWILALLTFSLIADGGYRGYSQFTNAMAWGIIAWIFTMFFLVMYLLSRLCVTQIKVLNLLELMLDACIVVYGVISAICFAYKIDDLRRFFSLGKHIAACIFMYVCLACFIISLILDIFAAKKPAAEQTAESAA